MDLNNLSKIIYRKKNKKLMKNIFIQNYIKSNTMFNIINFIGLKSIENNTNNQFKKQFFVVVNNPNKQSSCISRRE